MSAPGFAAPAGAAAKAAQSTQAATASSAVSRVRERVVPLTSFLTSRRSFNVDTPSRAVRRARRAQRSLVTSWGQAPARPPPIRADRVVLSGGRRGPTRVVTGSRPDGGSGATRASGMLGTCRAGAHPTRMKPSRGRRRRPLRRPRSKRPAGSSRSSSRTLRRTTSRPAGPRRRGTRAWGRTDDEAPDQSSRAGIRARLRTERDGLPRRPDGLSHGRGVRAVAERRRRHGAAKTEVLFFVRAWATGHPGFRASLLGPS